MRILGEVCLQAAFVLSGYAAFACGMSHCQRWAHLRRSGIHAAFASFGALVVVLVVLGWALVVKDYRFEYVAHYTSQHLPWHYSLSALWVGQAGSLLLWACLSAGVATLFQLGSPPDSRLHRGAFGVQLANLCFLVAILVFAADPMRASMTPRTEGLGLSPLLQHPSMLVHPPVVFLAYAAWTVPCALAVAAMVTGEIDARWTQYARRWALLAWCVLGAGLLLGANWAYQELGWGGYWGWDPVENGSLVPWLTGTALVHALMTWRHRGCLKKMAVSLAVLTFALCNFATFLTRSGIFSSVHAFSESPIGWMFLGQMAVLLVGVGVLVYWRRHALRPDRPMTRFVSREFLVLASAFSLLLLAAVVLVGTLVLPLSSMLVGRTILIGPAFYNNVLLPIGIFLLGATAVVPLVRWGAAPGAAQRRMLWRCLALAGVAAAIGFGAGLRHPVALAVTGLCVLAVAAMLAGTVLDARRFRVPLPSGLWLAWRAHRPQYAGYIIHLAFACVAVGVTGSSLGTQRHEAEMREGEVLQWAGWEIQYQRLVQRELADKWVAEAELQVARAGQPPPPVRITPARHLHLLPNEWTSEVAIHSEWSGDFYVILHAGLGEGRVLLTFVHNPLMRWIWLGGILAAGGAAVAAWPRRPLRRAVHRHRQDNNRSISDLATRRAA